MNEQQQVRVPPFVATTSVDSIGPDAAGRPTLFQRTVNYEYSDGPVEHNDKVMGIVGGIFSAFAAMVEKARKALAG